MSTIPLPDLLHRQNGPVADQAFLEELLGVAFLLVCGCGSISRMVVDRIEQDTVERVSKVEEQVEKLGEKVDAVVEEVEERVAEAVKTPLVGIIVALMLGAGLTVLAAFKAPTLVDEVIIGTLGFCAVLMFWSYRWPIIWTALAVGAALGGWKLIRKFVLPKITNGTKKGSK